MRLTNKDLEEHGQYGWSCATNGEFVATGGPNVNLSIRGRNATEGGKVVLYKKFKDKWVVRQELHNPDMDDYGWFGSDIEMNEEHLIISAHGYSERDIDDHSHRMGHVYIYKLVDEGSRWKLDYSINAPKPSRNGNFGRLIELKGDTLAVFYEHGENFNDFPTKQCIAFYDLSGEGEPQPFRLICLPKKETIIYNFSFDFNQKELLIGKGHKAFLYSFGKGNNIEPIDSVDFSKTHDFDGSITSVKLSGDSYFVGYHEDMYHFWGYQPVGHIPEGDSVIGKTIINPTSGKEESYILPDNPKILKEYDVSPAFFKDHGREYESYQSRAKRKAGAGSVFIYSKEDDKLRLKQELKASVGHAEDWFGTRIIVYQDQLLISALGYPDKSENHAAYNKRFSGAVFHFTKDSNGVWKEQGIYRSKHQKRWDKFGFSLDNYQNFFVIGCRFDDYQKNEDPETGAVYILEL